MSIDLNKKYALTGSQLTKLKTYIDNSGGGGSEILYGASEPDDSIGTDGQLYVVIPELADDDYSTIKITYNFPNGWKMSKQSFATYLEAYNFAYNKVDSYRTEMGIYDQYPEYPARIYGPYTELYSYRDMDYGGSTIYTSLSSAISKLNSKASEYGGSVTLSGTILTYTYNGQSSTYTNFNSCVSAVRNDYEIEMGWASWEFYGYTNDTFYYYQMQESWEGPTVFRESEFGGYFSQTTMNCIDYNNNAQVVEASYDKNADNKFIINYIEHDESLVNPVTETYEDVQQAADRFNELIQLSKDSLTLINLKAERL